jgi:hypothetical protein
VTASERACGTCGLCCKLVAVEELAKPAHQWCVHFVAGKGCTIYAGRPGECRTFRCLWLMRPQLSDTWRPNRSHIVLYFSHDGSHLIANVDPAHPGAWRQSPYYDTLRGWSRTGSGAGMNVIVKIGSRVLALLPDREVNLGTMHEGERLKITRVSGEDGLAILAQKVETGAGPTAD